MTHRNLDHSYKGKLPSRPAFSPVRKGGERGRLLVRKMRYRRSIHMQLLESNVWSMNPGIDLLSLT
jgi:hypothetical protein